MEQVSMGSGLLSGAGHAREGTANTSKFLIDAIQIRFPNKAHCLVEEWTIFRVDLNDDELSKVADAGHIPLFVFAHKVIEDSRQRFQPGDWVRSSMCVSFDDGVMFETKNTIYVLMGPGHEKQANLKTIFSFF